jgi:hypothetical protein
MITLIIISIGIVLVCLKVFFGLPKLIHESCLAFKIGSKTIEIYNLMLLLFGCIFMINIEILSDDIISNKNTQVLNIMLLIYITVFLRVKIKN